MSTSDFNLHDSRFMRVEHIQMELWGLERTPVTSSSAGVFLEDLLEEMERLIRDYSLADFDAAKLEAEGPTQDLLFYHFLINVRAFVSDYRIITFAEISERLSRVRKSASAFMAEWSGLSAVSRRLR